MRNSDAKRRMPTRTIKRTGMEQSVLKTFPVLLVGSVTSGEDDVTRVCSSGPRESREGDAGMS